MRRSKGGLFEKGEREEKREGRGGVGGRKREGRGFAAKLKGSVGKGAYMCLIGGKAQKAIDRSG